MADTLVNKYSTTSSTGTIDLTDSLSANESFTVLSISICNTTSTNLSFRMWVDGTTPNTDAFIYYIQSLPAESTFIHNSKLVLVAGDVLKFNLNNTGALTNIVVSMLKQTSVATSSGSDYLDRVLLYQTSDSQSMPITPNNTTDIKTVLSFTVCNHTTTATTFDIYARASGGGESLIYQNQSLPGQATFEHTDKIVIGANEELVFDQVASLNMSVVCSFLRQVP